MSVYGEYCVLSDSGLCDGPISRPEESYRLCVCVCVRERERERERVTDYTYSDSIENVRIRKKERERKSLQGETIGMNEKEIHTLSAAECF